VSADRSPDRTAASDTWPDRCPRCDAAARVCPHPECPQKRDSAAAESRETWRHMCVELIRDAAPNWIMDTPKGESCSECGLVEGEASPSHA